MDEQATAPESIEVDTVDVGTLGVIVRAEIDQQIVTAKQFGRSPQRFIQDAESWSCLNEGIAEECSYALPRGGKMVEGPSARMAEILLSAYGNARAGARVIEIGETMVRAQGYFMDLERNVAVTYEVPRRITDSKGRRYKDDMIVMTANAACSIALRNAIFRGIPQALWKATWEKSRLVAAGTEATLVERRQKALDYLATLGVKPAEVFDTLEVAGLEDVTLGHLATLKAIIHAVRDGELSIETAFRSKPAEPAAGSPSPATGGVQSLKDTLRAQDKAEPPPQPAQEGPVPPPGKPIKGKGGE